MQFGSLFIFYQYSYSMFMYLHPASWDSSATLTEVFSCSFLICTANARVKPTNMWHGPHSSKFLFCSMYCLFCVVLCIVYFVSFCVLFVLCRSVYCLFCVVLCIVCFVSFCVLSVCKCVLYCCHLVAIQLQLTNISHHHTRGSSR